MQATRPQSASLAKMRNTRTSRPSKPPARSRALEADAEVAVPAASGGSATSDITNDSGAGPSGVTPSEGHAPFAQVPEILPDPLKAGADRPNRPMIRQYELVERVKSYYPTADEGLLNRAYVYAMKMHGSQKRASGDPYFSHPLEVAGILTDLKLDPATIVTALLHDTIEDTSATKVEIEELFGEDTARLVEGLTKLKQRLQQTLQRFQFVNHKIPPNFYRTISISL